MKQGPTHDRILFWLGAAGLVFYALGPLLAGKDVIREPELLPVYTAMMGVGALRRKKSDDDD